MRLYRLVYCFLIFLFSMAHLSAQVKMNTPLPLGQKEAIVFRKNYPFLYFCYTNPQVRTVLSGDSVLNHLSASYRTRLEAALRTKPEQADTFAVIKTLEWQQADINAVQDRLVSLFSNNTSFATAAGGWLKKAAFYATEEKGAGLLAAAWKQEAAGINFTIGVYGKGQRPNYPMIDSVSFDVHDRSWLLHQDMAGRQVYKETEGVKLFFCQPLFAALRLLEYNGRYNSADFEPMEKTVNAAAVAKIKTTDWSKFPYTHIAVLGAGTENREDSINPTGILRCRLAAIQYFQGKAPFIVLSGGRVHPYKVNYSEAEEMKKYLMYELGIPAAAIIMEPHARHTTTNIRNTARLLMAYGIPINKAGIICTTYGHNTTVLSPKFAKRCINELGYVPYKLGKELSETEVEYYPLPVSARINVTEPLDP